MQPCHTLARIARTFDLKEHKQRETGTVTQRARYEKRGEGMKREEVKKEWTDGV